MEAGGQRRVLDEAAVEILLRQGIARAVGGAVALAGGEAGDRAAGKDEARQARVRHGHIRQRHIAGVGHREAVGERLAHFRRRAETREINRLHQREGRGRLDQGFGGSVIARVGAGDVLDFGFAARAVGIGAGHTRGILDEAPVEILLSERIARRVGGGVACLRSEAGNGPAREGEARQARVRHRDIRQRHVAGVRHREAVGEQVAHRCRRGDGRDIDLP